MDKLTRAAFLPSPGDNFVLLHFLHYFKTVWQDEVDKLYILINSNIEQPVINELLELLKHPKIVVSYTDRTVGHGKAIDMMLTQCEEDNVVLLEDDSIIFKKGVLDNYFKTVETEGIDTIVGSPRTSCDRKLAEELCIEFGLDIYKKGDAGPNFFPCFFFSLKDTLVNTDRNFGATKYGDTFVNTSIQLRRSGVNVLEIKQYHCSPDDVQNKENKEGIFDGKCGYMHFGSLSSGIENTLLDDNDKPLKDRLKPKCGSVKLTKKDGMEKLELERRIMWWNEAYKMNMDKFGEFGDQYGKAIEKVIKECGLSRQSINNMRKMYMGVINENK